MRPSNAPNTSSILLIGVEQCGSVSAFAPAAWTMPGALHVAAR